MSDESDLPLGSNEAAPKADHEPPELSTKKKGKRAAPTQENGFGLNNRQLKFCLAILKGETGTSAAKSAGYSERAASQQASYLLASPKVSAYLAAHRRQAEDAAKAATLTDAKWVRQRLLEESKYYGKDATQAARIRAIELIAKLNGDFEADNKQKAGIFDGIPAEALDFVRERLRQRGDGDEADRPSGGFTH